MSEFDIAVIGAGPAATAALLELDKFKRRIAIVTGADPVSERLSRLHPKIQSVSIEGGERPGVAEPLVFAGQPRRVLFSTAAVGGLANYWGQQCLRWERADPWPNSLFADFADYQAECEAIEDLFCLQGGNALIGSSVKALGFEACVPRLLTGTRMNRRLGLAAMRDVNQDLQRRTRATTYEARAISFGKVGERWRIVMGEENEIHARQLILAAGVIGNMRLLMRSFPDLVRARFRDHVPLMLYTVGLKQQLSQARTASDLDHFNALTLEQVSDGRSTVFASVYNMRREALSLVVASLLGRVPRMFRGLRPPWGSGLIQPVQVWTPRTVGQIEVAARRDDAEITSATNASPNPQSDPGLAALTSLLRHLGAHPLSTSVTGAGFGFHYHALELSEADGNFTAVDQLLRERTSGAVVASMHRYCGPSAVARRR